VYNRNSIAAPTIRTEDNATSWGNESTGSAIGQAACKAAFGVSIQDQLLYTSGQSFIDQNFDRMRPDLTEVSVPNFLIDVGQIKSLFKIWSLRRGFLSNVANANLNYQYGWKPTIGDISAMVNSIRNLQKKIDEWNRSLGAFKKRQCLVLSDTISKSGTSNVSTWGTVAWSGSLTRSVTAHITFVPLPLREMTNLERLLRGTLDSLGFELNPGILWDAIPFSFVVDWFLNIGSYLERFKLDTLELPFRLEDSYLQYKEVMFIDCRTTNNGTPLQIPVSRYGGSRRSEKFFHRVPIGPSYSLMTGLGWKFPTRNQGGLAASLAVGLYPSARH